MTDLSSILPRIAEAGLACRGGFHPTEIEDIATIILVGFTGNREWPAFANAAEAADGAPDPLDRWSRRVVGALAAELGATPLFPFGGPPFLPFQRWAKLAEPVHSSPLGVLIHPDWACGTPIAARLPFVSG